MVATFELFKYFSGKTTKALIHKYIEAFLFATTETILKHFNDLGYYVYISQVPRVCEMWDFGVGEKCRINHHY
jgi:hypothetical protein